MNQGTQMTEKLLDQLRRLAHDWVRHPDCCGETFDDGFNLGEDLAYQKCSDDLISLIKQYEKAAIPVSKSRAAKKVPKRGKKARKRV